jgi:hypothetical protein
VISQNNKQTELIGLVIEPPDMAQEAGEENASIKEVQFGRGRTALF